MLNAKKEYIDMLLYLIFMTIKRDLFAHPCFMMRNLRIREVIYMSSITLNEYLNAKKFI